MFFSLNKSWLVLLLTALIFTACEKEEDNRPVLDQLLYGPNGKDFTFEQASYLFGDQRSVFLSIPAGTVNREGETIEYYTFYLDNHTDLDHYYINFFGSDINLFRTSAGELQVPATVRLPFPASINYTSSSPYKPYKVKTDGRSNLMNDLNDQSRWQLITDFTWDNTTKEFTFKTADLNAAYVIARPK